jgi:uncharacterized surface protein with fasciclin (FAS1) repeats
MKTKQLVLALLIASAMSVYSCGTKEAQGDPNAEATVTEEAIDTHDQSGVEDNVSQKDVVKVAVSSKDHTTLVAAVKAADLVNALSNAGPFTVFAPTNDAFSKLPAGTVDNLLKPENKDALQNILQYHVPLSAIKTESFKDGQSLGMVNGDNAKITVKDGKVQINGANIIASVPASNGIVHVLDAVILPPEKK